MSVPLSETAALEMRTEFETTKLRLVEITTTLSRLQKLRVAERSDEQKAQIEELQEDKKNFADSLETLGENLVKLLSVFETPAHVSRGLTDLPNQGRELKFPVALRKYDDGVTPMAQWIEHTERTLQTVNFSKKHYVNALMYQCSHDDTVYAWVGEHIADQHLSWEDAKAAFAEKYGTVCVEEQHLGELWTIDWKKLPSSSAYLSTIAGNLKGAGISTDQYWVVSFAMAHMNPQVASLVRFGKKPSQKLSWQQLAEAVRDQEHNIRVGVVAPSFRSDSKSYSKGLETKSQPETQLDLNSRPRSNKPDVRRDERKDEWKTRKKCHLCGVLGHISPDCQASVETKAKWAAAPGVAASLLSAATDHEPTVDEVDDALREMCGLPLRAY